MYNLQKSSFRSAQPYLATMSKALIDKATAKHYVWGDHCDSWVLADTEGLSVKYESMPAGTSEKLHYHNHAQQFFFILKGRAVLYLDSGKINLTEHQGLLIHPGVRHYIENQTEDRIEFLVVSQPTTNNDRITLNR